MVQHPTNLHPANLHSAASHPASTPPSGRGLAIGQLGPASFGVHSWRQVLAILVRHFWKSLGTFVTVLLLAVAVIVFAPREYESTAQYLVRLGHESVSLDPVATVGETMGLHMTSDSIVRSTREIANSDELASKVVERITPEVLLELNSTEEPSMVSKLMSGAKQVVQNLDPISLKEKARITFKKNLDVSSPTQSNVIAVTYFSKSPQLSYDVMQVFSEIFLEEHNRINQTQGSFEFFVEQDQVLRDAMKSATNALRAAKQGYHISSIEGRRTNLESRLTETQASLSDNERALAASRSKMAKITEQLKGTPADIQLAATSGINQQTEAALRQQLYDLQIRQQELLSKYTPDHPSVQAVQKQLKEVSDIFAALNLQDTATSRGVNPVHQELSIQLLSENSNLSALEAACEVLGEQVVQLMQELDDLNDQEEQVFHLQTQLEVARAKYETHASKLEQARLEFEVGHKQITSIGVIQHPQINERPSSPNKLLVAALGLVAAAFAACALPFAIEYLRADVVPQTIAVDTAPPAGGMPQSSSNVEPTRAVRRPIMSGLDGLDGATNESEYASGKL